MKTKTRTKTKKPAPYFVLKAWDGKYFMHATGIGPTLTKDLNQAHRFETRDAAAFHPLANHTLCLFSVEEIQP